ncbi:MAG: 6-carboxytetrahydropterin synthase, partial [Ignavibacteria bacterium]|nr:6-carboxytetrahydropterin synthase [Ignavibacteria bacterium]
EDKDLIYALEKLDSKTVVVNFHSTAENICNYFIDEIKKISLPVNIKKITARIYETEDSYAEQNYELGIRN